MTRKLASLQKITAIRPIEGADKIVAADVLGWTVVVGKDEFKVGDIAVYFEVDSWLDASNPAFAGFEQRFTNWGTKRGMRLKTIKLRKQLSQGLLMPVSKFPELMGYTLSATIGGGEKFFSAGPGLFYDEGTDVTDILKIEKWESEEEARANNPSTASHSRAFPWFLRKTDQQRVQNSLDAIAQTPDEETFEVTVKLDGSSMTVYYVGRANPMFETLLAEREARELAKLGFFKKAVYKLRRKLGFVKRPEYLAGVCSRKVELPLDGDNHFSAYVREHGVVEKILVTASPSDALAFQGELIAPSIQKNYEKVAGYEWHVFDVFDIEKNEYLSPILARMATEFSGLQYVPVLDRRMSLASFRHEADASLTAQESARAKVDNILAFAEGPGMNKGVLREGIVFKSNKRDFSFKAVSNSYLLGKG